VEVYPKVHLLGMATAGDAAALEALGIDLLIICGVGIPAPHNNKWIALPVDQEGVVEDGRIEMAAVLWVKAYDSGWTLGLTDRHGGRLEAAFMVACSFAQRQSVSFDQTLADLESRLPEIEDEPKHRITAPLIAQGLRIWA
jgi:hypothetical protein